MNIVQINTVCGSGSVGRIASDLYHTANENGHNSFFAYGRGTAPVDMQSYKIGNPMDFGLHVMSNFFRGNSGFASTSVTRHFLNWLDELKPDLLHLHNIHGFFLHTGILFDYIKEKQLPVVWTLHDCWPFTGQCAYFDYADCTKWKTGCYSCPIYRRDYPYSIFKDNSYNNYHLKKYSFTGVKNLHIVTPSKWLANLVSNSFLGDYPISVIPNGIDLEIFCPRQLSPEPANSILGVANVWSARKGLPYFLELVQKLDPSWKITIAGLNRLQKRGLERQYQGRIIPFTRISSLKELTDLYNASTVYVNPTLEDNFPTTNLEALACGKPVITFNTGGSPECLDKSCGIVVEKGNIPQLAKAIYSLKDNKLITRDSCRKKALLYDKNLRFKEYIKLYELLV